MAGARAGAAAAVAQRAWAAARRADSLRPDRRLPGVGTRARLGLPKILERLPVGLRRPLPRVGGSGIFHCGACRLQGARDRPWPRRRRGLRGTPRGEDTDEAEAGEAGRRHEVPSVGNGRLGLYHVHPRDGREFEALVRFTMRPPVSLSRLHFTPGSHEVLYVPKGGHEKRLAARHPAHRIACPCEQETRGPK